jgi:hypothetical protein
MSSKPKMLVAPCSHDAAKYAVETWYYTATMPKGKLVKHGVWENDKFVGVIIYGRGATNNLGKPYGLTTLETCEMVRMSMDVHQTPTSRILGISLKMLKKTNPGLRLVVSFADGAAGHSGTVYKASNWVYLGLTKSAATYLIDGEWAHGRECSHVVKRTGQKRSEFERKMTEPKHRFVYPLDDEMRAQVEPLRVGSTTP